MKSAINIYGCGGAGIKAAAKFETTGENASTAEINCYYLDTGYANIEPLGLPKDSCFIFECKDELGRVLTGAGKNRALVVNAVMNNVGQVPETFEPSSVLNIVISSGSGGSGSVICPALVKALNAAGHTTIVIMIGSHESVRSVTNTINTLVSLDNMARSGSVPVVMSFHNNQANQRIGDVDEEIKHLIAQLAVLCSGNNSGLDSEDIRNFVRFNTVTSTEAQLACLDVVNSVDDATGIDYPVAIASLLPANTVSGIGGIGAEYFCDGEVSDERIKETHFIVNVGDPAIIVDKMKTEQQTLVKKSTARPKTQPLGGLGGGGDMVV